MNYENDRFRIPEANLRAAARFAKMHTRSRFWGDTQMLNSYVPTRKEVATLPKDQIHRILLDWMTNSAIEIIPSPAQISEVKSILLKREDVTELSALVAMCDCYIRHDG